MTVDPASLDVWRDAQQAYLTDAVLHQRSDLAVVVAKNAGLIAPAGDDREPYVLMGALLAGHLRNNEPLTGLGDVSGA